MHRLGRRQLEIMRLLWRLGEATVSDLRESLETAKPLAHTTIATMISRLEKQGLVAHRVVDRAYVYRAVVSEDRLGRTVVHDLIDRMFSGSAAQLVSQVLESDQVDAAELRRIRELVNARAAQRRGRGGAP